jgi:hypothetical protein
VSVRTQVGLAGRRDCGTSPPPLSLIVITRGFYPVRVSHGSFICALYTRGFRNLAIPVVFPQSKINGADFVLIEQACRYIRI